MSPARVTFQPRAKLVALLMFVAALGVAVTLVARGVRDHLDALAWVRHTLEVRRLLAAETVAVDDVTIGAGAYLLTGDRQLLAPLSESRQEASRALGEVRRLTADNPAQQQRLVAVEPAVGDLFAYVTAGLQDEEAGRHEAAVGRVHRGDGRRALGAIRRLVKAMDDDEQRLLAERTSLVESTRRQVTETLMIPIILLIGPLGLWVGRLRRSTRSLADASEKLRGSEEKFRLLADHATDLVVVQDLAGRAHYVSPSSERLLGIPAEEIMRMGSLLNLVHPDDVKLLSRHADDVMDSRDPSAAVRFRLRNRRGEHRWFESRTFIVEDKGTQQMFFQTTARDVNEQVTAEGALARSREVYRMLVKNLPKTAVVLYDRDLKCQLADGPGLAAMMESSAGAPPPPIEGRPVDDLISPDNREMTRRMYEGALAGRSAELETMHGKRAMNVTLLPLVVEGIEPMGLAVVRDVTEERQLEDLLASHAEEVRSLSLQDELTGLNNRRGFVTLATQQLKFLARARRPLAVLFIDLNGMKPINDKLGHQAGDDALRDTAAILRATFRDSDILARLGGDEFAALVNDVRPEDLPVVLARLEASVERHNQENKRAYRVSISVGVVEHEPSVASSIDELLAEADKRMYEDKRKRKALAEGALPLPRALPVC
jgi:diguanylate cyclase (GGDEF)-like protein/PAS domain S-box-containing protein